MAKVCSQSNMMFSRLPAAMGTTLLSSVLAQLCAQEIIYDNTTTFLNTYTSERREFGDELELAGTARVLKEIAFEYYGEFVQQGDEFGRVRIYSNEKPYDAFRNEPTRLLYESGLFGLNPGFHSQIMNGFNTVLPDIITLTVEFYGLLPTEKAGLLLYSPPTVGFSYNELWRRNESNAWEPIIYSLSDTNRRANVSVRLKAVDVPKINSIKVTGTNSVHFDLSGLSGANYVLEGSADFQTWSIVATQPVTSTNATFSTSIPAGQTHRFFRLRVP